LKITTTIKAHLCVSRALSVLSAPFTARKCSLCSGVVRDLPVPKNSRRWIEAAGILVLEASICGCCYSKFAHWFTRVKSRGSNSYTKSFEEYQAQGDSCADIKDARHIDIVEYIAHLVGLRNKPKWLLSGHGTRP